MSEQTTVTLPAYKQKGYGRDAGISVSLSGASVYGHGKTLSEAKQSAIESLLELATVQQSGTAATVFADGDNRIITVYYPQGTGTGSVNIHVRADGTIRRTSTSSMGGTPEENAERAAEQQNVTRI